MCSLKASFEAGERFHGALSCSGYNHPRGGRDVRLWRRRNVAHGDPHLHTGTHRHPSPDAGADPNRHCGAYRHIWSHFYPCTHSYNSSACDPYTYGRPYFRAGGHRHSVPHSDARTDSHPGGYHGAHADPSANCDSDAHTDPNADALTQGHSHTHTHPDAGAAPCGCPRGPVGNGPGPG